MINFIQDPLYGGFRRKAQLIKSIEETLMTEGTVLCIHNLNITSPELTSKILDRELPRLFFVFYNSYPEAPDWRSGLSAL